MQNEQMSGMNEMSVYGEKQLVRIIAVNRIPSLIDGIQEGVFENKD